MTQLSEHIEHYLEQHHPNSPEFKQAVQEVWDDVEAVYVDHERYVKDNLLERMLEPDRMLRFRVCWEADDGSIQVNRGWRVQYNNALGAYKGGLRFHPTVSESVLKFLAFEQCFKNALTGLPMGGAKGGSDFDPKGRSEREIMRFCHAFMDELYRHIGPDIDVPAGDINVGAREIGYLFGHYLKLTNRWEGVLTGKSPTFGGSCGRTEATGYGVVYFLKNMLQAHDQSLEGRTVLISGSGNVALHAAEKCLHEGAIVLTLSDSRGSLSFSEGLTLEQLKAIKDLKLVQRGSLADANCGEYCDDQKPWGLHNAEIALPCATQNEVEEADLRILVEGGVVAIAEGANMPLTHHATALVHQHNLIYGPGKASNAGGVAVSGLERSQNAALQSWPLERVDDELKQIMRNIHGRCIENIEKVDGVYPYSKGANLYGFRQIAETLMAYGVK